MDKLKNAFLMCLSVLVILTGCGEDEDEWTDPVSATVLIYMAADNSMDSEVEYTLEQLKSGVKRSGGTTVVYLDRKNETPRLFRLSAAGEEIALAGYDEENSASAETLARVIRETKELFPADQFGLVYWSHAMGWLPSRYSHTILSVLKSTSSFPRTRYIGTDDDPGNGTAFTGVMEVTDMAEELPDNTAEFILFDVCLMGSVEALYELRHTCRYIIASPAEVLAEAEWNASGMPYSSVLPFLFGGKEDLIKACQQYYSHYNGLGSEILRSATITLVDTGELDNLYEAAFPILNGKLAQVAGLDISGLQVYHTSSVPQVFFDLRDVLAPFGTAGQLALLDGQLGKTILYKAATNKFVDVTINPDHFSGLSHYVPLSKWKGNGEYTYYFTMEWSNVYGK